MRTLITILIANLIAILQSTTLCPASSPALSTHSNTSSSTLFVSISRFSAPDALPFVIESAGLELLLIQRTSAISLLSYACRKHRISIMSLFSAVVPSLTRQSYRDLESVQRTSGRLMPSASSRVDLIEAPISNPWARAYSSDASTLLVTLLHFVED